MDTTKERTGVIQPNDVTLIFRPLVEDGEWTGQFQILISAFGPATLHQEVFEELVSVAMLAATSISYLEKNQILADEIIKHGEENLKESLSAEVDFILSSNTKTYGGVH